MPAERVALGYLRVSTERQAGELVTSLGDQEKAIVRLASTLSASIERIFRDEGASGATVAGRPAFRALLEYCAKHPRRRAPGYVLFLNASRFGRFDDPDEPAALRFQLRQLGWEVRFAEGDAREDAGYIERGVIRAVGDGQAGEYRQNIIRNAQRGSRGTAEKGFWTRREPFGYLRAVVQPADRARTLAPRQRKAPDEKIKLTPGLPNEVATVKWLFESFVNGRSIASLVPQMQARDSSRKWSRHALKLVLTNRVYLGEMVHGRRSGALVRQRIWWTDPSTWLTIPNAHEPLIDLATFEKAQLRLGTIPRHRSSRIDYLVTGLVTCSQCGEPYIGGGQNGAFHDGTEVRFYKDRGGERQLCAGKLGNISKHLLEAAVIQVVAGEVEHGTVRAAIRQAARALENEQPATSRHTDLSRELARAESRRDRLIRMIADGVVSEDEGRQELSAARETIDGLRKRLASTAPVDVQQIRRESDRWLAVTKDFGKLLRQATGPEVRGILAPFLAGATFDKDSRELRVRVRTVPFTLSMATQPVQGCDSKDEKVVVLSISLKQERRGQPVVIPPLRRVAGGRR